MIFTQFLAIVVFATYLHATKTRPYCQENAKVKNGKCKTVEQGTCKQGKGGFLVLKRGIIFCDKKWLQFFFNRLLSFG